MPASLTTVPWLPLCHLGYRYVVLVTAPSPSLLPVQLWLRSTTTERMPLLAADVALTLDLQLPVSFLLQKRTQLCYSNRHNITTRTGSVIFCMRVDVTLFNRRVSFQFERSIILFKVSSVCVKFLGVIGCAQWRYVQRSGWYNAIESNHYTSVDVDSRLLRGGLDTSFRFLY